MELSFPEQVQQVVAYLKSARRILFITGAGLSADSGMPTYRGVSGLYGDEPVEQGMRIEDILSAEMMIRRPAFVWKYLGQLADSFQKANPNDGHLVISAMEKHFPHTLVLTQNVDGLHQRAGSEAVIDVHGDIHLLQCTSCAFEQTLNDLATLTIPPKCPECGEILRPGVVLFDEMLDPSKMARLQQALLVGYDVVFSVGTSSLFPYINQPVLALGQRGAKTIEINPGETDLSQWVDVKISRGAAESLAAIWNAYQSR